MWGISLLLWKPSAVRSHHRGLVWRGRGLKGWSLDVKGHMCTFAMTFGILWTQTPGHKLELVTRLPKSILLHRCLSENKSNKCIKGHNPEEMGICLYQDVIKYVFTILTQRQSQEFFFFFFLTFRAWIKWSVPITVIPLCQAQLDLWILVSLGRRVALDWDIKIKIMRATTELHNRIFLQKASV